MVGAAPALKATVGDLALALAAMGASTVAEVMAEVMAEVLVLDTADLALGTDLVRATPPSQCISSPLLPRCMPSLRP